MKKYVFTCLVLGSFFIGLSSCEKDDFCVENPVTPNLVLRFYDKENTSEKKKVTRFSIIAQNKDSLFVNQNTDSINIPLNSLDNQTVYTLKMNATDNLSINNKTATLTINYKPEEVYVSRSCGYKVIFNDVKLTHTGWIDNISTSKITTIDNQKKAHVQIYF
ncbi:DUF6452 family protein [Tenacibaculum piscium]|uniref:DUF6452 family protein n=1 Tax=Tenacibaculum piscium TaxID=1458515 RepID=UPI00187B2F8C|nr:DUF6452 family protein [Tenacibaculum piscium]MBE7685958.1 hypothetical protein [Tenacibaculum piscium]MBE7690918.1 hypothetical protein [Tenacibaculum piscium]